MKAWFKLKLLRTYARLALFHYYMKASRDLLIFLENIHIFLPQKLVSIFCFFTALRAALAESGAPNLSAQVLSKLSQVLFLLFTDSLQIIYIYGHKVIV